MFKNNHFINAGEIEINRYGNKAVEKIENAMQPNDKGFYSIATDAGGYWTIGTSNGKYGEFAKFGNDILSVNAYGYMWAKVGTAKEVAFLNAMKFIIDEMNAKNEERIAHLEELNEEAE